MAEDKKKKKQETPEAQPETPAAEQAQPEEAAAETFTVTREQMEQMEALAKELAGQQDKVLRLAAEYDNFRKRSQKEKDALYGDIKANTLRDFLPVYDNLCRALSAETADEAYKRGVELIYNQLMSVFKGLGVTAIEAEGQPFDPQLHNAVIHVEDETVGDSTVVQELQKGFRLGDRVIRFSMVKVAN